MGPRSVRSHFLSLGKTNWPNVYDDDNPVDSRSHCLVCSAPVLYSNCYSIPFFPVFSLFHFSKSSSCCIGIGGGFLRCTNRNRTVTRWSMFTLSPSLMFCATNTERVIHLPSCGRGEIHHHRSAHTHISAPHPIVNIVIIYKVYSIKRNDLKPRLGIDLLLCAAWDGNPSWVPGRKIIFNDGHSSNTSSDKE